MKKRLIVGILIVVCSGCSQDPQPGDTVWEIETTSSSGVMCRYKVSSPGIYPRAHIIAPCGLYQIGDTLKMTK